MPDSNALEFRHLPADPSPTRVATPPGLRNPANWRCQSAGILICSLLFLPVTEGLAPTVGAPRLTWPPPPDPPRIEYVQDLRGPRDIGEITPWFRKLGRWVTGDPGEDLVLRKPFGLAVDEHGDLCITDTESKRLFYCDLAQKHWRRFDGVGSTRFSLPVAVARRHGIFYLADSGLGKVLAFNDDARLSWQIASPLQRPVGLAVTPQSIAVVDSQLHAVLIFDFHGQLLHQFGRRGVGDGEFNFPTHIASDSRGRLLVSDSLNCRVQVFDEHGVFITQFGSNGDTSGHFSRPKGLAVDSAGHIYVADALFDNIQIFDSEGGLLLNLGQAGSGPGEFGLPAGLAISSQNRLYVADSYNHRVQVFQYLGAP